jgi:3-oxoacyl-[acyl-carrier protein] reductase
MPDFKELSRSVKGLTVLVTGAASGMGRATALVFAAEGAHVAVTDVNAEATQAVAGEIAARGGSAKAWTLDVAKPDEIIKVVNDVAAHFGSLDIVVNNAGISLPNHSFQDEAEFEDNWARTVDINLTSHVRLIRLALPILMESDAGRVVNIASTESIVATAGLSAYAATKAGVTGLTRSLAVELGRHGVTVNCICPGPIDTGMTAPIPQEAKETYARRRVPLRRYGYPEEVAQMTLNLCLPASSFVNGATIPVDGGMTVRHT